MRCGSWRRCARHGVALVGWLALVAQVTGVHAQTTATAGADVPVLLVMEDEDPNTVRRSSEVAKRVRAEVGSALSRLGYRVIDEETLAADAGLIIHDRSSRGAIVRQLKNSESLRNAHLLAMVQTRAIATREGSDESGVVRIMLSGELYDLASGRFLDSAEAPPEEREISAACLLSMDCLNESVKEGVGEIASAFGKALGTRLQRHEPGGGGTQVTAYTLTFRYFEVREVLSILGVVMDEFPGSRSLEAIYRAHPVRRYRYVTSAGAEKLEEWLYILLGDMGLDVDREVLVEVDGLEVTLEKKASASGSEDDASEPVEE